MIEVMRGSVTGKKPRVFVEVGQRFNRLVVTEADLHIGQSPKKPAGWRAAACRCDCGTTVTVTVSGLASGKNQSCGCMRKQGVPPKTLEAARRAEEARLAWVHSDEGRARAATLRINQTPEQVARGHANRRLTPRPVKHGLADHPLYRVHAQMMRRCYKADWAGYKWWGGRGIRVHEPWHDVAVFIADIEAEVGPRPDGKYPSGRPLYSLDRIDNDGNYEPGNVRWATMAEQCANRRHRQSI